eukprot:7084232-Pyramimonas_sp.AAC.1
MRRRRRQRTSVNLGLFSDVRIHPASKLPCHRLYKGSLPLRELPPWRQTFKTNVRCAGARATFCKRPALNP